MKAAFVFAALVVAANPASADPRAAKAEALFRHGRELMQAGKFADACAAFDASQKLDPATTTLFNQADCREKNNQLATAWGLFVDADRQTRAATDDVGAKMHEVAQKRATALESRLSKITVTIKTPADGLAVLRDGELVDAAELGRAMPVDGGTYNYTAQLGGKEVWAETITVQPERDAAAIAVEVQAARLHAPAPAPITEATTSHRSRVLPIAVTAGAVVLLGGALVYDLLGDGVYNDAVKYQDMNEWNTANTDRYVAEGLLVAGIGTAAVATYLWLRHDDEAPPKTMVSPTTSRTFTGIQLSRSW